jgi:hypothetical protein
MMLNSGAKIGIIIEAPLKKTRSRAEVAKPANYYTHDDSW